MSIFAVAFTFFLVANPIGNSPAIIGIIKDFDLERQKRIMLREAFIAFCIAIFFQFCGEVFLQAIHVKTYTLSICGGILLLLVGIQCIFAKNESDDVRTSKKEPFFVPIATPLITGPGLMTIIMIYAQQEPVFYKTTLSICIAWIGVTLVLMAAPYMKKVLKDRGMLALEQLMGLTLTMISMEMIVKGASGFLTELRG